MKKTSSSYPVNLPKTGFPMKGDLPVREPHMLRLWEAVDVYGKLEKKNRGKASFILHDGPPYANGHIHIGHVVNKVLKDFVVKFRMMTGRFAPYVPGWDCHGLPIEHQLMKEKHINKHKVDRLAFRREAARFAERFVSIQREEFKRLGCMGDWDHPYLTMTPAYEKNIVRTFHALLKNGFIYRKKKPVLWCASCETALADAEVEYHEHTSPSIYVAFALNKNDRPCLKPFWDHYTELFMVIWTTTPWTLPANVAIALKPKRMYRLVKKQSNESARYLVEDSLWQTHKENFSTHLGLVEDSQDTSLLRAEDLVGCSAQHPFVQDRESMIIAADFVDTETGTGAVHIAPGHGEEDYLAGMANNLPIISPVDDAGRFTGEVPQFSGTMVFASNDGIIELLRKRNA
ncbi:MAG: class I tRNA ligase family protein, partial [Elusimicrobia bacterium]|nr:class I tRNA ligase family protein [Elusimicrobiota bacterium]MBD3412332.1 class I tRNA ligase family protein [Elusimicrobiota bacterium]